MHNKIRMGPASRTSAEVTATRSNGFFIGTVYPVFHQRHIKTNYLTVSKWGWWSKTMRKTSLSPFPKQNHASNPSSNDNCSVIKDSSISCQYCLNEPDAVVKGAAVGARGSAELNRSQDVAQQLPSHVGNIFKRFTSLKQRLSLSDRSFIIGDILKSLKTSFVSESEPNMGGGGHHRTSAEWIHETWIVLWCETVCVVAGKWSVMI